MTGFIEKVLKSKRLLLIIAVALALILAGIYYFSFSSRDSSPSIFRAFPVSKQAVFEPVLPDAPITFPESFDFQKEFQYGTWHYFANLADPEGNFYSVKWTYHRMARDEENVGGWNSSQLYLSNVVVYSEQGVWKQQRIARGGIGQAGLRARPFRLWIDSWTWRSISLSPLPGILNITTDEFSLALSSVAGRPFVPMGNRGYQQHHDLLPVASYGFQSPYVLVSGHLTLSGREIDVSGGAWISKEWGSDTDRVEDHRQINAELMLDDGRSLRVKQNRFPHHTSFSTGSVVNPDGSVIMLTDNDISMKVAQYSELESGVNLPLRWTIKVEKLGIAVTVTPRSEEMWHPFLIPYWEGPVTTTGTHRSEGSLRLTGY